MKKRIAVLLLAMALILSLCPTAFAAAKIDVDKTAAMAGEQVVVTLTNETELTDITNLDYRVYYDKDCFTFTSGDNCEVLPMSDDNQPVAFDNSVPMHDDAGDYIAVNVVDTTSEGLHIAVGAVYTLTFTVKDELASQRNCDFEMVRHSVMDTTFKTGDDVDPALKERVKVTSDVASVTVKPSAVHDNYAVTLSDDFIGTDTAVPGADYTFSAKDLRYDYTITAIMGDENVDILDNGDGTYTIKTVNADLTITATKVLKPDDENHTLTKTEAVPATCSKDGNSAYYTCSDCDRYFSDSKGTKEIAKDSWVIKATGVHTYKTTTTKATLTANGKVVNKCSVCGKTTTKTVYMPKTFSLSYTKTTYNGKAKTPAVTVKDSKGNVLKKGTDYTVTYAAGRKAVGTYKVTVKGIGKYSFTKTLSFKINPAATKIVSATNVATKSIKVKWSKAAGAGGYQVKYVKGSTTKTVTVKGASSLTKTLSKLTKGATYKVYVRSYRTVGSTNYYSAWSAYKSVKVAK